MMKLLFFSLYLSQVKTYSICDGRMHHLMKGPHSKVLCLCGFANENNVLAVGCSDKRIRIHDGRLEDPVITLRGLSAPPCSLQVLKLFFLTKK